MKTEPIDPDRLYGTLFTLYTIYLSESFRQGNDQTLVLLTLTLVVTLIHPPQTTSFNKYRIKILT